MSRTRCTVQFNLHSRLQVSVNLSQNWKHFPNNIFVPGEVTHGDAANSVKKSIIKSTKPNSMPRSKPSLIHFGENFLITSKLHDMIAISM